MSKAEPHVVRGACPLDCPDTCSWEVTVENGRATDLRGTRDHPFTRGNLCVKVNRYLEQMASSDRLLYPMRRVGAKGEGRFERFTWDEALGEIADKLGGIAKTHGAEAILPYYGTGTLGFIQGIEGGGQRFWNALGATRHLPNICSIAGTLGSKLIVGPGFAMDPETLPHAKLIILWGTNPLSCGNHVWRFITEARRNGAHIVAIDPIRTRSATQADEHLPILPGTDAALALGLLHVVLSQGAEDKEFLAQHTVGWDAFRQRILDYPPSRVAEITGIPEQKVVALGERLAATRPTAIRLGIGMQRHSGGGTAVRTIMAIPGITGDWQHLGGGATYSTGGVFPGNVKALTRPDLSPPGTRGLLMTQLGESLLNVNDPPVKALFVYAANPAASTPHQNKVREGLAREDLFTVVVEHFQTDTADYADILLPSTMQPEHADIHNAYGHLHLMWNEPAVAPPGECLPHSEIFRRLARTMGLNEPCLYDSDEELAEALLASDDPALEGVTLQALKREGWLRLNLPDPFRPLERGLATPSGKIEFHSAAAERAGHDPLPTYLPPNEVTDTDLAQRYPLALVSPGNHYFLNSSFANNPTLRQQAGPITVSLHPDDAAARGLSDGNRVRVFNDRGGFDALIRVSDIVQPGVAASDKGHWPKLLETETNINMTVDDRGSDMGGGAVYHDNRVQVEAAS